MRPFIDIKKILLLFHVIMGYLSYSIYNFNYYHMIITLLIVSIYSMLGKDKYTFSYLISYLISSEIIWRMKDIALFWEIGKILGGIFIVIGIIKFGFNFIINYKPILYFLMLTPSLFVVPDLTIHHITFNLGGPFLLAISYIYFSNIKYNKFQLVNLLYSILYPIIITLIYVILKIGDYPDIKFTPQSNIYTSGEYGPNQMSTYLSLGFILSLSIFFLEKKEIFNTFSLFTLSFSFIYQTILTFSRGGSFNAIFSLFAGILFPVKNNKIRNTIFMFLIFISVLLIVYLIPKLVLFTEGVIEERYSDISTTGRDQIILADIKIFLDHPIFGVGPGRSKEYHTFYYKRTSPHTEFSRLLAEHGIFGLISGLLLISLILDIVKNSTDSEDKSLKMMLITWSIITMLHSATRLAVTTFILGISSFKYIPKFHISKNSSNIQWAFHSDLRRQS